VAAAQSSGIRLRPVSWGLRDGAITLIGSWATAFAVAAALAAAAAAGAEPGIGAVVLLGAVVPWIVLVGWPVRATRRWGNGPVIDLGWSVSRSDVGWGLGGGLAIMLLGALAALLTQSIAGPYESAAGQAAAQLARTAPAWQVWAFALVVLVGAPVAEELAFRGMLWAGVVRAGAAPPVALAITAGVFALFHFEPVRIGVLLVVGAGLGWLRMRTGGLGAPTIAHAVNNAPGALAILGLLQ
jgi:hypothetical protein